MSSEADGNIDGTGNNGTGGAGTGGAVRDDVYCHLTARRAVARAALYLGTIDSMSVEALDTLAGVLLAYLSRIGQTLAACTEASGRSSAHCHVVDCLRAVELCTEAAVQRVHFEAAATSSANAAASGTATTAAAAATGTPVDNATGAFTAAGSGAGGSGGDSARTSNHHARIDPAEQTSWKGLAAFCFGPNWQEPLPSIASEALQDGDHGGGGGLGGARRRGSLSSSRQTAGGGGGGGGGKVGPASTALDAETGMAHEPQGWDAPYPEDIHFWPVISNRHTANPHTMAPSIVESLHNKIATSSTVGGPNTIMTEERQKQQNMLEEIPDAAFTRTGWGRLLEQGVEDANETAAAAAAANSATTGKRKEAPTEDSTASPAKKKTRFNDDTQPTPDDGNQNDKAAAVPTVDDRRPFYVPRHFPPFPRPADIVGRTVLDDDALVRTEEEARKKKNQDGSAGAPAASDTPSTTTATSSARTVDKTDPILNVRSALVQLGQPWGSGWDKEPISVDNTAPQDDNNETSADASDTATNGKIAVPVGRTEREAGSGVQPQIVPLGRASGSRVSRILEGSMDAAPVM